MYATTTIRKNAKSAGRFFGVHQKIDKSARAEFRRIFRGREGDFPKIKEILHFEGDKGPDGIKRKSPGEDEEQHHILPGQDDGKLIKIIENHSAGLSEALATGRREKAAFEAAWLAHAVTDGLTPAHHVEFQDKVDELMIKDEFVRVFGAEIKGVMRGETMLQSLKNNWKYWGRGGLMSSHVMFEGGIAVLLFPMKLRDMWPPDKLADLRELAKLEPAEIFYKSLEVIAPLNLYDEFLATRWSHQLVTATKTILIPEIVKCVAVQWAHAYLECKKAHGKG